LRKLQILIVDDSAVMRKIIERALRQAGLDLGELCSMVAGNFKAKISSLADHCMLSVPTVITGENYAFQSPEPSESVQVSRLFESSPIHISLITQS